MSRINLVPCLVIYDEILLRYKYFCTYNPILYSRIMGCNGNFKNQRALILEDNIFWHLSGPIGQIYSHNEMSYVCNLGLITPLHTIVYPLFFPHFKDFINNHEYANEIIFI